MKIKDFMTKNPKTLKQTDTFENALKLFAKHKITGCPIIDSDRNVIGIVTQSDIVKIIDVHSAVQKDRNMKSLIISAIKNEKFDEMKASIKDVLKAKLKDYMKKDVICIGQNDDAYNAARLLNEHDIERLPVTDGKKLVGIVTRKDVINVLNKI